MNIFKCPEYRAFDMHSPMLYVPGNNYIRLWSKEGGSPNAEITVLTYKFVRKLYNHELSSQRIHSQNCKRREELKKLYPQLYK